MSNFLDQTGLSYLWGKIKSKFLRGNTGGVFYGTCSTAAGTVAKVVECADFTSDNLKAGTIIIVTFTITNSGAVANLTMNVNSTGAKHIKYINNGTLENLSSAGYLKANTKYPFYYDGAYWVCWFNDGSEKQDKLTFDSEPTKDSPNAITSGAVYNAVDVKQDKYVDTEASVEWYDGEYSKGNDWVNSDGYSYCEIYDNEADAIVVSTDFSETDKATVIIVDDDGNVKESIYGSVSNRVFESSDFNYIDINKSTNTKCTIMYRNTFAGSYVTKGKKKGTALGSKATAEGTDNISSGSNSHSEGEHNNNSGTNAHAEGYSNTISGMSSHVEGNRNTVSGSNAHGEGSLNTISGNMGHGEGYAVSVAGYASHAEGQGTSATVMTQHVFGSYNIPDSGEWNKRGTYVEIVGNGTASDKTSNARTLDWSGNEVLSGKLTVGAEPVNDMDVTTKKYVDSKYDDTALSNRVTVLETKINNLIDGNEVAY